MEVKDETRLYKRGVGNMGGVRESAICQTSSDSKVLEEKNNLCSERHATTT